ncbi:hypothetical protein CgunFtcFv8_015103 [Champsocephalus gunnari]|uniref:MKRN2 opposite strand protein n=1 Tax=Champsocephalus gunnari TaxID=52237 RepID=A0AAN8E3X9_CHAGU|nr:hypothetical protein CgunFtcFv8_015103 [Champsocephalus gunnari]
MDPPVIRLAHCQVQVFCLQVPGACPSCGEDLRERRLQEAPVSLPSPFSNAHKTSCCLLVAPAHNNTTSEFDGTSDLHTGISNTEGVVYNYTRAGVVRALSGWERCVSVPLVRPDMFPLLNQWDQYLQNHSEGPSWDPAWHRFDEQHQNCLSFCLSFVNRVLAAEGREALSREAFTQTFILPRVQRVQKYLFLCRHLQTHPYYLVDREGDTREDTREDTQEGI